MGKIRRRPHRPMLPMVREAEACISLPRNRSKSSLTSSIPQAEPTRLPPHLLLTSVANSKQDSPFGRWYCCRAVDVLVTGARKGFFTERLIGSSSSEGIAKSLGTSRLEAAGPFPTESVKRELSSLSICQRGKVDENQVRHSSQQQNC